MLDECMWRMYPWSTVWCQYSRGFFWGFGWIHVSRYVIYFLKNTSFITFYLEFRTQSQPFSFYKMQSFFKQRGSKHTSMIPWVITRLGIQVTIKWVSAFTCTHHHFRNAKYGWIHLNVCQDLVFVPCAIQRKGDRCITPDKWIIPYNTQFLLHVYNPFQH